MYDFDDEKENRYVEDVESDSPMYKIMTNSILGMVVRGSGLLLLLIGMWMGIKTLNIIIDLYETPETILRFADKIEQGSGIDKAIAPAKEILSSSDVESDETGENKNLESYEEVSEVARQGFRISYFFAWGIVLILLLILGRLSLIAIKVGGELVLYDVQLRRFVKELLRNKA